MLSQTSSLDFCDQLPNYLFCLAAFYCLFTLHKYHTSSQPQLSSKSALQAMKVNPLSPLAQHTKEMPRKNV